MKRLLLTLLLPAMLACMAFAQKSWSADNGNGTYTNPLFYDEFSDPDMIRVGEDFYLAGTTMHSTPGLVILHSQDLVNWEFMSYCFSAEESLGTLRAYTTNIGLGAPIPEFGYDYELGGGEDNFLGAATLHQGGIVDLPNGEWWGFSMNDFRAVGRTTCLSPVTWVDGWPYFGLPGNLGRSPRTWTKPNVQASVNPTAPYLRCDNFDSGSLLPVWQWNHDPDANAWSIKNGKLNLTSLPASDFLWAKNTLTQRCIGPVSAATVTLDTKSLKDGDLAGISLLNTPYQLIGIKKDGKQNVLTVMNQLIKEKIELPINEQIIYLRSNVDLDNEKTWMSYSTDGKNFKELGSPMLPAYQMKTFQGPRFALFSFNQKGVKGGVAQFDDFIVDEPMADRSGNLPIDKVISLRNLSDGSYAWANPHGMLHKAGPGSDQYRKQGCFFKVHDRGNGKVALEAMNGTGFLTVVGIGLSSDVRLLENESEGSLFMWQDMLRGQCMLMSMKTQRYIGIDPTNGSPYAADKRGCNPDRRDGTVFAWEEVDSDGIPRKTENSVIY